LAATGALLARIAHDDHSPRPARQRRRWRCRHVLGLSLEVASGVSDPRRRFVVLGCGLRANAPAALRASARRHSREGVDPAVISEVCSEHSRRRRRDHR
jgi:hypothetical protein